MKRVTACILTIVLLGVLIPLSISAETEEERRERLEDELAEVENEIFEQRKILHVKRQETQSIERDIAILNAEIREAQLSIRAKNLAIGNITTEMQEKEQTIESLSEKIVREKESLAQLVRRRNEIDSFSLAEIILGSESLSTFFQDLDNVASVKTAIHSSLSNIRDIQAVLRNETTTLEARRRAEADARYAIEQEKQEVEAKEDEKQVLLFASKSEEQTYEQVISQKQREANEIRNALFQLRDAGPIKFEDALRYARAASQKTGVRTAFILGILKQESDLGANVGQCYLTDPATGAGVGKNTGRHFDNVMKPGRDVEPFLKIADELGFDPYGQVVSCPQWIGYGGAMGPSQFIPSTWMMYKDRVASTLGVSIANPWEPRHAFMATALFLQDLGAVYGGWSAEREAAARYFAGGGWQTNGLGYADSVLSQAENIQRTMIDPLEDL
ncbi:MAG: lytic murein transglycosylase [Candidatus Paceibacterota bacterium]